MVGKGEYKSIIIEPEITLQFFKLERESDLIYENYYPVDSVIMAFNLGADFKIYKQNGQYYDKCKKNDCVILKAPAGKILLEISTSTEPMNAVAIIFSLKAFRKLLGDEFKDLPQRLKKACIHPNITYGLHGKVTKDIFNTISELDKFQLKEAWVRVQLKGQTFYLIGDFFKQLASNPPKRTKTFANKTDSEKVEFVSSYLTRYSNRDIIIKELCQPLAITPKRLNELFKKQKGSSVKKYHVQERMKQAYKLLKQGELNTSQVADAIGYQSISAFHRSFKAQFGIAPSEIYRS